LSADMHTADRRTLVYRMVQLSLLLLVSLYPVLPSWFDQRLPTTHEGYRYLLLSDWFTDAIAAGVWYPRWIPEMNGGFGYPEFVFYQPGYFFINALVSIGVAPLLLRQVCTLSLVALVGGSGVYCLARRYVAPAPSLLLVACFQLAPYVHTNLYMRGDLSEWMVQELVPWPIFFLLQLCRPEANETVRHRFLGWLGLAVSTAVICYSHPVGLMFLPPILLVMGGICLVPDARGHLGRLVVGGELIGAIILGLVMSSPYWFTVLTMKPHVNVAAALDGFVAWKNTVPLSHLLFGSLISGKGYWEFLGAPFVVAALAGCWFGRKEPFILGAGLAYIVMVFAMTPLGQLIWRIYPFSLLQFPWRLAVFAPVLQVICLVGWCNLSGAWRIGKLWLLGGFFLLACWSLSNHFGFRSAETQGSALRINHESLACLRSFAQTGSPGRYVSTIDAGEWMPLTAKGIASVPARGEIRPECDVTRQAMAGIAAKAGVSDMFSLAPVPRPLLEVQQQDWQVRQNEVHTAFKLDYHLSGGIQTLLTINQVYLPGWTVVANGTTISRSTLEQNLSPDGRMQLDLPPGEWRIQAWYGGPPGWRLRNVLIATLCGIAAIYWLYRWHATGRSYEQH